MNMSKLLQKAYAHDLNISFVSANRVAVNRVEATYQLDNKPFTVTWSNLDPNHTDCFKTVPYYLLDTVSADTVTRCRVMQALYEKDSIDNNDIALYEFIRDTFGAEDCEGFGETTVIKKTEKNILGGIDVVVSNESYKNGEDITFTVQLSQGLYRPDLGCSMLASGALIDAYHSFYPIRTSQIISEAEKNSGFEVNPLPFSIKHKNKTCDDIAIVKDLNGYFLAISNTEGDHNQEAWIFVNKLPFVNIDDARKYAETIKVE